MFEQISILDLISESGQKKQKQKAVYGLKPAIGKCEKQCANYNTTLPDGKTDRYATGQPRCVNMSFDDKSLIINNMWYCTCKNFKTKGDKYDTL